MACKDLSRERGAMVYIVSVRCRPYFPGVGSCQSRTCTNVKSHQNASGPSSDLSQQMNRVGYHFRHQIVQEAMHSLNMASIRDPELVSPGGVERIPQSQRQINEQADAAIRELFPKIPNTDRGEIINHAFRKVRLSRHKAGKTTCITLMIYRGKHSTGNQLLGCNRTFPYRVAYSLRCWHTFGTTIPAMMNYLRRPPGRLPGKQPSNCAWTTSSSGVVTTNLDAIN